MRPILAALLLLSTAAGAWGHDDAAQPNPAPQVIQAPPSADIGDIISMLAAVPDGGETAWAVMLTPEGLTLILTFDALPDDPDHGRTIVSHAIAVKRPPPGDNDDPPDDEPPINEKVIQAWLDAVPIDAREVAVDDPFAKTTASRQQMVSKTFKEIGQVAKLLGSIRATNVMLGTGLSASYGDGADDWAGFDASVRKALATLAKDGANAVEYGAALVLIGEVLR